MREMTRHEANIYAADKLVGKSFGKQFAQRCLESFSETEFKWDIETEYSDRYWKEEDYYTFETESTFMLGCIVTIDSIQVYAPDAIIKAVDIPGDGVSYSMVNALCDIVLK